MLTYELLEAEDGDRAGREGVIDSSLPFANLSLSQHEHLLLMSRDSSSGAAATLPSCQQVAHLWEVIEGVEQTRSTQPHRARAASGTADDGAEEVILLMATRSLLSAE